MQLQQMKLESHQLMAIKIIRMANTEEWPLVIVECESKIIPDEKIKVIAALMRHIKNGDMLLIPIARMFEEAPMIQCMPPINPTSLQSMDVDQTIAEPIGAWKIT